MCNILDGIFTFALIFEEEFLVARDPIGVKPLFYGVCEEGRYYFRSITANIIYYNLLKNNRQ